MTMSWSESNSHNDKIYNTGVIFRYLCCIIQNLDLDYGHNGPNFSK